MVRLNAPKQLAGLDFCFFTQKMMVKKTKGKNSKLIPKLSLCAILFLIMIYILSQFLLAWCFIC